jgi:hypothetical protein
LVISVGIRESREIGPRAMVKAVSIACELANNRIQAVSSAKKETI